MSEVRKRYDIPLEENLSSWKRIRVQVDVLSKGSRQRPVKLKQEFEVLDDPASPLAGIARGYLRVSDKKLVNDGASVEFCLTVDPQVRVDELGDEAKFRLQVKVKLDLAAIAQAMGAAVGAALGGAVGGMFGGGGLAVGLPDFELKGTCEVWAQMPKFEFTLQKFRWETVERKKLTDFVALEQIRQLYREGGELKMPVSIEPAARAGTAEIHFDGGIQVYDVQGRLYWMGSVIEGEFRDEDRTCLVFPIKASSAPPVR